MKDYADWIRKDGLQAGRDGPVVSSDWTDAMLEVAEHIERIELALRDACSIEHEWRSSTFEEKTSPHWVCRRCKKAEPKKHDEWYQQERNRA